MFNKLLLKELKGTIMTPFLFVGGFIILWNLLIRSRLGIWPDELIVVCVALQVMIPIVWTIAMSVHTLQTEWSTNSIYLLLSLPVRGRMVLGSKGLAVLISILGLLFVNIMATSLVFWSVWGDLVRITDGWGLFWVFGLTGITFLVFFAFMIVAGQAAFMAGRMVPKFRGLSSVVTFLVGFWLLARMIMWIRPCLGDFGTIKLEIPVRILGKIQENTANMDLGGTIITLLVGTGYFLLCSWLYDRRVEL